MIISVGKEERLDCLNLGTHNGIFHCDDTVGITLLGILFQEIDTNIIRSRDTNELKKAHIVIDIGGGKYDHHIKGFNERRPTGEKYASAGLVWRDFGKSIIKIVAEEAGIHIDEWRVYEIKEQIDKEIIIPIDDEDDPENVKKEFKEHTFSFIPKFYPSFLDEQDFDAAFMEVLQVVTKLLKAIIKSKVVQMAERPYLRSILGKSVMGILELPAQTINWVGEVVKYNETHDYIIKFVIFPHPDGGFAAQCVPPSLEEKMAQLIPFPKEWAGENEETLPKISGIKGAASCHNGRFFARAKHKKAVVDMCLYAMKQKQK